MDPSAVLPYLTGPVAALALALLWIWTQRHDIGELRKIIEAERKRADAAEAAARATYELIAGLLERRQG